MKVAERTQFGKEIGIVVPISDSQKTINGKQIQILTLKCLNFLTQQQLVKLAEFLCHVFLCEYYANTLGFLELACDLLVLVFSIEPDV
ncbi:hypothetical protein NC651_032325 [Populus alba x Populus x berolinensis]|nr:hypothetical protein NC651_032325 [Populus alba x Populus x berolinensis]